MYNFFVWRGGGLCRDGKRTKNSKIVPNGNLTPAHRQALPPGERGEPDTECTRLPAVCSTSRQASPSIVLPFLQCTPLHFTVLPVLFFLRGTYSMDFRLAKGGDQILEEVSLGKFKIFKDSWNT